MTYQPKDIAGKISKAFLNNPLTPIMGIFILLLGFIALEFTPREENPQIKVSGGSIIVALPGATAQEVRKVIVEPLEREIKEIKAVENIYGMAMDNVGIVNVQYFIGEKKIESNVKMYDKIMQNRDIFPEGILPPVIKPLDIDTDIPILSIAFYSPGNVLMPVELTREIRAIQQRINAVQDVAVTELIGAKKEQFNVLVDLKKLSGYNLSLGQIVESVRSLAVNVPDITDDTGDNKLVIFGIKNAIESVRDIENIIVSKYRESFVYLRDIATVKKGTNIDDKTETRILVRENGRFEGPLPQVTLTVSKIQGTNAVRVVERVLKELESLKPQLENAGVKMAITRDDGYRADKSVNDLVQNLLVSIVIVSVLLVFTLGWKESLIVMFAIPAILAMTLFTGYLTDQTINRITLFALLMSLGMLVDAAIIVVENINRHMKDPRYANKTIDDLLIEATDEIGSPTNIATFAIVLTMVPMWFVGKMMGEYMGPIPGNVPVALLSSLLIAYIFAPYMAKRMVAGKGKVCK